MTHFQNKMGGANSIMGGMMQGVFQGGGIPGLSAAAAPPPTAPDAAAGGSFRQRPPMRRPTESAMPAAAATATVPPPSTHMESEIAQLREERAVLQAQLRQQATSFSSPFVVMSQVDGGRRNGPHIEML